MTSSAPDIHMPHTDSQAKSAIDAQQRKVDKISKLYLWLSNFALAVGVFIIASLWIMAFKGHAHPWTLHFILLAAILGYKGLGWIWESQLSDIRMAEWMQDTGMRALNEFELIELKRSVEPCLEAKRTLQRWQDNNLVVRVRDKNYLDELRGLAANANQQGELDIVLN